MVFFVVLFFNLTVTSERRPEASGRSSFGNSVHPSHHHVFRHPAVERPAPGWQLRQTSCCVCCLHVQHQPGLHQGTPRPTFFSSSRLTGFFLLFWVCILFSPLRSCDNPQSVPLSISISKLWNCKLMDAKLHQHSSIFGHPLPYIKWMYISFILMCNVIKQCQCKSKCQQPGFHEKIF